MGERVRLDLGDGVHVDMDAPTPEVLAALARVNAAQETGADPNDDPALRGAMAQLWQWLEAQEEKYPSPTVFPAGQDRETRQQRRARERREGQR